MLEHTYTGLLQLSPDLPGHKEQMVYSHYDKYWKVLCTKNQTVYFFKGRPELIINRNVLLKIQIFERPSVQTS